MIGVAGRDCFQAGMVNVWGVLRFGVQRAFGSDAGAIGSCIKRAQHFVGTAP